jgi:hypothetical protein
MAPMQRGVEAAVNAIRVASLQQLIMQLVVRPAVKINIILTRPRNKRGNVFFRFAENELSMKTCLEITKANYEVLTFSVVR